MSSLPGFFVRLLILFYTSIAFQVILSVFGSFRKRSSKKWSTLLLWSAYQLADVVATTGLGMITSSRASDELSYEGRSILSSFLLWHLGGPDSITAFSLVDNELYFRHLLQLIYLVGVAGYIQVQIFVLSRRRIAPRIMLFLAGISKYGERTWALHSATMASLRDSMLPPPNPGPSPLLINDDDDDNHNHFTDAQPISVPVPIDEYASTMPTTLASTEGTLLEEQLDSDKAILLRGHNYFCNFRYLFVDLIVPNSHIIDSKRFFLQYPCKVVFQLIDIELRFVYDMLFTKTPVVRTWLAYILRIFRFSALLYYIKSTIPGTDAYQILVDPASWSLAQEIYEVIQMLLSEWTVVWLNTHGINRLSTIILRLIVFSRFLVSKIIFFFSCGVKVVISETRIIWWYHNIMAQFNLFSFCFKDEPTMFKRILRLSSWGKSIHEWIEKSRNTAYMHVPDNIRDFIYQQFKEMVQNSDEEIRSAEFRNPRGKWAMKMNNFQEHNCLEELGWSVDVEFDRSILIWHVAADLCYYCDDLDSNKCEAATLQIQVSKVLSNYLLYLLLIFPFMLNCRIGEIRFQDTCATIKEMFDASKDKRQKKNKLFSFIIQSNKSSLDVKQRKAYIMRFLKSDAQVLITETKSDESKSVLFEAHRVAKLLQLYEKEKRWKIVSGVWVEMLSYAARNCTGKHHAQRLCDGGEFLTKVWLLMAHLGMVE